MADTILLEQHGDVLLITLNRPDRLNAWNSRMGGELSEAIGDANSNPGIGAIVVTGAGRAFCAGADIADTFADRGDTNTTGSRPATGSGDGVAFDWVNRCLRSKPLIAAVNGVCIGVGVTQILSFDAIVASDRARFGIGFIKMGLVPELAATRLLGERMGRGNARLFALTGDLWTADEALAAGLVDRVVDGDQLLGEVLELAARIAGNPAPQLQWTKQLLDENAFEPDLDLVQRRELDVIARCFASAEHAEAIKAFLEKRAPEFPPRVAVP